MPRLATLEDPSGLSPVSPAIAATLMAYYITAGIPAFSWGPPGAAKTETAYMVGSALRRAVIPFHLSTADRVDLAGVPSVADGVTHWNPPAVFPRGPVNGLPPIMFWDELNTAPVDVMAVMMPGIREGKIGSYTFPDGTAHLAAGNLPRHRAAGKRLPSALANRFGHILWASAPADWLMWAAGGAAANFTPPAPLPDCRNGAPVDPMIRAYIHLRPDHLSPELWDEADRIAVPSPRTWELVSRVCRAPAPFRFYLVAGLIGTDYALDAEAFFEAWAETPSIPAILSDPDAVHVPGDDKPGARYAVVTALARLATPANVANAFRYVSRLPRDLQTLFAHELETGRPDLITTAAYTAHAVANQSYRL